MLIAAVFFPFILLAFFPSFPAFLLKLQLSRHKGPCGLDQMFQAAHFPTLCLMEYSWATRHRSTAQHRAAQTRDHLFIYFITLLPGCLMHNNSSTYKGIFSPPYSSLSHPSQPFSFKVFLLIWIHKHTKLHICGCFDGSVFPLLSFTLLLIPLSPPHFY